MALRVVLADDNFLVRQGTAALLAEVDGVEVVDVAEEPAGLLAAVATHAPDAVLTDLRMPPTFSQEGIEAAKEIRRRHPGTGVVVLSQYVEPDDVVDLLSDGVAGLGYLLKERVARVEELVAALHQVVGGGSALDPQVVEALLARRTADNHSSRSGPRMAAIFSGDPSPFWIDWITVAGPSSERQDSAAASTSKALVATTTRSQTPIPSVVVAIEASRIVWSPLAPWTRRPLVLTASTCSGHRQTPCTSWPASCMSPA